MNRFLRGSDCLERRIRGFEAGRETSLRVIRNSGHVWMEIQAIRSGWAPRDQARIDTLFAIRQTALGARKPDIAILFALEAIVADFEGLRPASLRRDGKKLSASADPMEDSAERRIACRLLRGFGSGARRRTPDPEYRKIVEQYRPRRSENQVTGDSE